MTHNGGQGLCNKSTCTTRIKTENVRAAVLLIAGGKKCEEAQKAQIVKKKKTTSKEKKRKMKERIKKKQKKDGLPSTSWCRPTGSTPFGSCLGSQSHLLRIKSYYI
jgi:GH24 family phage-related lysozyme (muramidase)